MITLDDLYKKLNSIEDRIGEIETIFFAEPHGCIVPLIEEHAKKCHNPRIYMEEKIVHDSRDVRFSHPETYIKCQCQDPSFIVVLLTPPTYPKFFQQYIKGLNEKYKKTPLPSPEVANTIDLLDFSK